LYSNVFNYKYNEFNDKHKLKINARPHNQASEKKIIENASYQSDLEVTSPDICTENKQGCYEQLCKPSCVNTSNTTIKKDILIGLEAEAVHKHIETKIPDVNCLGITINSHCNNIINDYGNFNNNKGNNKEFSPSIPSGAYADSNADSFIFNLQDYLDSKDPVFYLYDIDMIVTHDLYYDLNLFCDF
jgi:hypothetical protein